jgi:hypothetical protein
LAEERNCGLIETRLKLTIGFRSKIREYSQNIAQAGEPQGGIYDHDHSG